MILRAIVFYALTFVFTIVLGGVQEVAGPFSETIVLPQWGRGLRLYLTNPALRRSMKAVFDVPPEVFEYAGYGLFVGRK